MFLPFVITVLWMGLQPGPFLNSLQYKTRAILQYNTMLEYCNTLGY